MSEIDSPETGKVLKVICTDPETGWVHALTIDGNTTRFQILRGDTPVHGAIIILFDERWESAPDEAWISTNMIGTVRSILGDGVVLIDDGLGVRKIPNPDEVLIKAGNTVEYNAVDGIVSVLSERPIRSREYGMDPDELLKEYRIDAGRKGPGFEDFGGYPHVTARARELIETQLERRDLLDRIGARPVKGVLFTGPPGTGKTHLARIIAHESQAEFYLISGPSIISKWVGDTEETLRRIFDAAAAAKSKRAIIFFDEIDSIAERRSGESHEASKRLVAQLLTLMDGFSNTGRSVVVIAATNRIESLDPALTRPGRFDWEIEFGLPTLEDRADILRVHMRPLKIRGSLPVVQIAEMTHNWSSAELSAIWSEAALLAAGDKRDFITDEDMVLGFERIAQRPRRQVAEGAAI